jgi:hypothetical protein
LIALTASISISEHSIRRRFYLKLHRYPICILPPPKKERKKERYPICKQSISNQLKPSRKQVTMKMIIINDCADEVSEVSDAK